MHGMKLKMFEQYLKRNTYTKQKMKTMFDTN